MGAVSSVLAAFAAARQEPRPPVRPAPSPRLLHRLPTWSRTMGKKKPKQKARRRSASAGPRVPRKEPYSPARIGAVVERVKEQTSRLSGLAKSMDEATLSAVVIDGHAMLIRGLNQIDNFIDNASRAVREAKSAKQGL